MLRYFGLRQVDGTDPDKKDIYQLKFIFDFAVNYRGGTLNDRTLLLRGDKERG